jgi:hypothetical protein
VKEAEEELVRKSIETIGSLALKIPSVAGE